MGNAPPRRGVAGAQGLPWGVGSGKVREVEGSLGSSCGGSWVAGILDLTEMWNELSLPEFSVREARIWTGLRVGLHISDQWPWQCTKCQWAWSGSLDYQGSTRRPEPTPQGRCTAEPQQEVKLQDKEMGDVEAWGDRQEMSCGTPVYCFPFRLQIFFSWGHSQLFLFLFFFFLISSELWDVCSHLHSLLGCRGGGDDQNPSQETLLSGISRCHALWGRGICRCLPLPLRTHSWTSRTSERAAQSHRAPERMPVILGFVK